MAVAARCNPKDFFTGEEWARLSAHSSWRGVALIAHCWAVIGAAMVMAVVWPITIPLAIMIIGARQLGLAILMHDAAHGALHSNLRVNDWLAQNLCGGGLTVYRPYHLTHHRYAQQGEDPDLVLSAPFPITRLSLRRKIVRDLTGQTFFKLRFGGFVRRLKARKPGEPLWPIIATEVWRHRTLLIGGVVMTAALAPFGLWWVWAVLWLAPKATWLPLVTRLRNIAEHACVAVDEPDPLRQARTTRAGFIERALIAPYYVNYHCEHHMFMHLPCYSLPRAHKLLMGKGVTERMEVRQGYLSVLRMATAA